MKRKERDTGLIWIWDILLNSGQVLTPWTNNTYTFSKGLHKMLTLPHASCWDWGSWVATGRWAHPSAGTPTEGQSSSTRLSWECRLSSICIWNRIGLLFALSKKHQLQLAESCDTIMKFTKLSSYYLVVMYSSKLNAAYWAPCLLQTLQSHHSRATGQTYIKLYMVFKTVLRV